MYISSKLFPEVQKMMFNYLHRVDRKKKSYVPVEKKTWICNPLGKKEKYPGPSDS